MREIIASALFLWVGIQLDAPAWYYVLAAVHIVVRAIEAYKYVLQKRKAASDNYPRQLEIKYSAKMRGGEGDG